MDTRSDADLLEKMRQDWDQRAVENAEYYVESAQREWDRRQFFQSGEVNVANEVMPDMFGICCGTRSPFDLSMVEIGCGVGRMTKPLSRIFKHVTAVDVSGEMLKRARANLEGVDNVTLVQGDGQTLAGIGDATQDFAFSFIVFQHVPSLDVIRSYCREVYRVLRPHSLFKFQVQGGVWERNQPPDTWTGVSVTEEEARKLAAETGFIFEYSDYATEQFFWLWFRKPRAKEDDDGTPLNGGPTKYTRLMWEQERQTRK